MYFSDVTGPEDFRKQKQGEKQREKIDLRYYATPPDAEQAVSNDQM